VSALCELPGPLGSEDAVRDWLIKRWSPRVAELAVTPAGDVIARVGGGGRRVALVAHMDEVAFFVTELRNDGFLSADPLRPTPSERRSRDIPIGQPARVMTPGGGHVDGTFATTTGHVAADAGGAVGEWWIDVGLNSVAELAAAGVHIGAPVIPATKVRKLGTRLVGKAMDDRALLAAMTALIERGELALGCELWLVATVQEEIGAVGASALGQDFRTDVALVLDVAPCGQLPGQRSDRFALDLGGGPVLVHKDLTMVYDRKIGGELLDAARAAGRALQDGVFPAYLSDGRELLRYGARTALLALPCRYTHSPYEMVDLDDLEALVEVLAAWLRR
jgi:endoglucanase